MSEDIVNLHFTHEGVATVTLNRPDVHNAFNDELIEALTRIMDDLGNQEGVRAIILAGAGKSFSAGADLQWMKRAAEDFTEEDNREDARALADLMGKIYHSPKPTIALVQGSAYGGGLGLVAACDIAIAVRDANFAFSEVRLGLIPAVISPYIVEAIGARNARRLFITAESFDALEAHRMGLVHILVEDVHLLAEARDRLVEHIYKAAPGAIGAAKELIYAVTYREMGEALQHMTADFIARQRVTAEANEGIDAFLNKRKPRWGEIGLE